jgi:3-oxoacyl-[acyl-carrier-protein] synthase II
MKRVVITGMGAVSPLGVTAQEQAQALDEGRHGIRAMPEWAAYKGLRSLVAAPAELRNEKAIPRQNRRSMGRMSIFAAQAALEAAKSAGVDLAALGGGRTGCVAGSTTGSAITLSQVFETMLPDHDFSQLQAMQFFQCLSHTVAINIAQYLGLQGVLLSTNAACASSLQAIGTAFDLIRSGRQEAMFCGGAEELHATVTGSFDMLMAASTRYNDRPEAASRPFDAARDGLVCGEGAGILFLEERERAQARGATILAEVLGFHTCSGGSHISESNRDSIAACMQGALADAHCAPSDVEYVNAHATATLQGDGEEVAAIRAVLGDQVAVSSLKGNLGHTLGASGAIELIATVEGLRRGRIYPTRNLESVAEECKGVRHVVAAEATAARTFMKNSFAFGGINASLVCRLEQNGENK